MGHFRVSPAGRLRTSENILHCETNLLEMNLYTKLEIAPKPCEVCFKPAV
jgi:hypothetical protein